MRCTMVNRFFVFLLALPLVAAFAPALSGAQGAAATAKTQLDGKAIFLAQKCELCHSVSAAGIQRKTKSEKMAGPDLSDVASRRTADSMLKILRQKEMINGKKHTKPFTGTDEELGAMVSWLGSLKAKGKS